MSKKALAIGAAVCAVALTALALAASPAMAAEELVQTSVTPTETKAGGHPDVNFTYEWKVHNEKPLNTVCHCDDVRTVTTDSPTGLIGNPHSVPTCTLDVYALGQCAVEAQVGYFGSRGEIAAPVYNVVPHPDQAGLLAFTVPLVNVPVFLDISARTESDYGLVTKTSPTYHLLPLTQVELVLWGVPADASHNPQRFVTPYDFCLPGQCQLGAKSNAPRTPFLQNPTTCGVDLTAGVSIEYYTGNVIHAEVPYPGMSGCDNLSFNPSLTAQPTTTEADSPAGLDVNLKVPQVESPDTPSPSEIRSATMRLPAGFSLNPGAADGKTACSAFDSAIGRTRGPATCPEFSKIGSAQLDSAALPGPVPGAIYIGEPEPGNRFRVILTGDGFGTHIKLAGSLHADSQTGGLTISFLDLPQTPLTEFDMHIFGSERGAFSTPTQCGVYPVDTEFVPWDDHLPTQTSKSSFEITSGPNGGPCPNGPRPFHPVFDGGTANPTAGSHTPFNLKIDRADGDQFLSGLDVKAAPGIAATLRGVPYCSQSAIDKLASPSYSGLAEIASPACPAASQVGTVTTGAGPGTHPVFNNGKIYLAGPYKGAPLSFETVIPAVSGPYDLGVVAVRAALYVDPATAQVRAVSDPLPSILEGVPLRARMVDISFDRPNFTFNPTNCDPFSIDASILGDEGATASLGNHFQVANCADLAYAPNVSIALRGNLKRRGHPAIHAVLTAKPGEANTREASVTLPKGELLDNAHIGTVCTNPSFATETCPEASIYGEAEGISPVLDQPVKGLVYLRSSHHKLPDLAIKLKGQVDIELVGRVDSVDGRLRVTFEQLPDVPVSTFVLDMMGGPRGLVQNSEPICKTTKRGNVRMTGQNGVALNSAPKLVTACGSAKRHKRHARRHRRQARSRTVR
jgi:hypothetical protein